AASVEVAPADASRFDLSAPAAARAGQTVAVTLTAYDSFGNRATGYTGIVKFRSDDPQAGLPSAYTFTPADGGVKTFQVTFRTAGAHGLSVSHAAPGSAAAAAVPVAPADASRFELAAPKATDERVPFAVTLTAFDAFGNRAFGFTGTVTFSSDDPRAVLPAPVRFAPDYAVRVTVPGVVLRSPCSHRIHSTSGSARVSN